MVVRFLMVVAGLSLLSACGSVPQTAEDIPNRWQETIAAEMAAFGSYTLLPDQATRGELVEAKTQTTADFYFDEDGNIPKVEVNVPLGLLPEIVRTNATNVLTVGDSLDSVQLVYLAGTVIWGIDIRNAEGVVTELYFNEDGTPHEGM